MACKDGRDRELKHCPEHETTQKHQAAISFYRKSQLQNDSNIEDTHMEDDFDYEDNEYTYSDNGTAMNDADLLDPNPSDSYTADNSINTCLTGGLVYSIEATSDELAIARLASTLTNYSLEGPSLDSYTYSDEDEIDGRDSGSSSSSGEHLIFLVETRTHNCKKMTI